MLKLFSSHNSICTQKVFITLEIKGQPFETQNINLFANEQFSPEYLKINPKGVVPSLEHDGEYVIESSLICEYLEDVFPAPTLAPKDPAARARMRLWSKLVDEQLFEATRELSFSAMFRERMRNMTEEQREGRFRNTGDPMKRARLMSTYAEGVESPYVLQGIGAFEMAFAKMEKELGKHKWLISGEMTLADINMMPFAARLDFLDLLHVWIADRPKVKDWWRRVQTLPAFISQVAAKTTPEDAANMKKYGGAIAGRVGERRAEYMAVARG